MKSVSFRKMAINMAIIDEILNLLLLTIGGYLFSMGGRNFASFFLVIELEKPLTSVIIVCVIPAEAGIQSERFKI